MSEEPCREVDRKFRFGSKEVFIYQGFHTDEVHRPDVITVQFDEVNDFMTEAHHMRLLEAKLKERFGNDNVHDYQGLYVGDIGNLIPNVVVVENASLAEVRSYMSSLPEVVRTNPPDMSDNEVFNEALHSLWNAFNRGGEKGLPHIEGGERKKADIIEKLRPLVADMIRAANQTPTDRFNPLNKTSMNLCSEISRQQRVIPFPPEWKEELYNGIRNYFADNDRVKFLMPDYEEAKRGNGIV